MSNGLEIPYNIFIPPVIALQLPKFFLIGQAYATSSTDDMTITCLALLCLLVVTHDSLIKRPFLRSDLQVGLVLVLIHCSRSVLSIQFLYVGFPNEMVKSLLICY